MTNEVKVLSDDEVAEIERVIESSPCATFPMTTEEARSLCATARALREKYDSLKSKIPWHRDGVGPDVPVSQERYDRLMAQRTVLTTGLANIYHVITNEECDRAVVLGMATSAVSSLLRQRNEALDQCTELHRQLAQVTQERDQYADSLESATRGIKCDD